MEQVLLTILTLNVLQTGHQGSARYAAIEAELQTLKPDVVTLQEVKKTRSGTSADALLPSYHRVVDGRFRGYHLAILSRYPIKRSFSVPFPNNRRRMALAAILDVDGREVMVMTSHLDYQLNHHAQRKRQLAWMFEAAAKHNGTAIVTADFNFGDGEPENGVIPDGWRDAWRTLHPNSPGYTWDNEKNPMANRGKLRGEPSRRLDRILIRNAKPVRAELRLNKAIRGSLFPSDHFAVFGTIEFPPR